MSEPRISREDWLKTDVAKASTIACGYCGQRFATPHDFYKHRDTVHPKKKAKKNGD